MGLDAGELRQLHLLLTGLVENLDATEISDE
jgi:hypothetical protein